jgi:tripartite-type tricarboxylate transporter receptor subunit TctC
MQRAASAPSAGNSPEQQIIVLAVTAKERDAMAKFSRRQILHLAAGATALRAVSRVAMAQAYPSRPITMIVPDAAGGSTDVLARLVAERMRKPLGQPVIVEDVSGADGNVGIGRAARAKPDGYTINLGYKGTVLNAAYYSLPYDVLNDFAPIALLTTNLVGLFARKTLPAKDLKEFIAWLKANPKASAGISYLGSRAVAVLFQKETGTHFSFVPYRGNPAAVQDLMAGQIDMLFGPLDQLPLMRAAGIKAYAVTGETRIAMAPEIPTYAEMGLPAIVYSAWEGLFAPKGTPTDHRQAQRGGRGGPSRSRGAISARRAGMGDFPARTADTRSPRCSATGRCSKVVADH